MGREEIPAHRENNSTKKSSFSNQTQLPPHRKPNSQQPRSQQEDRTRLRRRSELGELRSVEVAAQHLVHLSVSGADEINRTRIRKVAGKKRLADDVKSSVARAGTAVVEAENQAAHIPELRVVKFNQECPQGHVCSTVEAYEHACVHVKKPAQIATRGVLVRKRGEA